MKIIFRMTQAFAQSVRKDLARPHRFAFERVAWISTRAAMAGESLVILAQGYHPVADDDYENDPRVGAMMGSDAIRKALDIALLQGAGIFHVHMHEHRGSPLFSKVDVAGQLDVIPDLFGVRPDLPHGAIVLSHDRAAGRVWLGPEVIRPITEFNIVGPRLEIDRPPPGSQVWLKA